MGDLRGTMHCRIATIIVSLSVAVLCQGQAVRRKQLVTALGFGGGSLAISTPAAQYDAQGLLAGAVRFTSAYAVSDRWSLGIHYERTGTNEHSDTVERVRFTTYLIAGAYRPLVRERSALEMHAALGSAIMALRPAGGRVPVRARGGAFTWGARWLHMINGTVGMQLCLDQSFAAQAPMELDGEPVVNAEGQQYFVRWNALNATAGVVVRF
jgi:hypothetical protein